MDARRILDELARAGAARPHAVAFDDGRSVALANATLPAALFSALERRAAPGMKNPPRGVRIHAEAIDGLAFHLILGPGRADAAPLLDRFRLVARGEIQRLRAETDGMTGLPNKRSFLAELDRRFADAARLAPRGDYADPVDNPAARSVALVMFDVDHFKRFNDEHGHLAGDHVLVCVAGRLREAAAACGFFPARYGGEEFAVIARETEEGALRHAETIRRAVADLSLSFDGRKLPNVHVSLGVAAIAPAAAGDLHRLRKRLIERADAALYAAKEAGRNRAERYSALRRAGRVLEAAGGDRAVVTPGALHGAAPGDVYRVIHRRLDGRRNVEDPRTGKSLGPAPLLVKGTVELLGASQGDSGSDRLSVARALELLPGMALEPGDLLELDESRPAYPTTDLFDRSVSLGAGTPRTAAEAVPLLPRRGEFAVVAVPDLGPALARRGRAALRDDLARARARFQAAGIALVPLSSDKALALPAPGIRLAEILPGLLEPLGGAALLAAAPGGCGEEPLRAMKAALSAGQPLRIERRVDRFDDRIRVLLAHACIAADRLAAASSALEGVRDRASRAVLNAEGVLLLRAGDPRGALERFERAAAGRAGEKTYADLLNLGAVALRLGDAPRALRAFRRARALMPDDPQANNNLACALLASGGSAAEALRLARRAVALCGAAAAETLYEETVAHALLALGRAAEAARILEPFLARRPDCTDAYLRLAQAREALSDPAGAREALSRLARIRPDHPALAASPASPAPPASAPSPRGRGAHRTKKSTEAPCI